MSGISDDCKKKIKELEGKLIWSIKSMKDSEFRGLLWPDFTSFLILSFRFDAQNMDEGCKKLMGGYADDILHLRMSSPADQVSKLEAVLASIQQQIVSG